ncbi:MAG: hypothetical protein MUD00_02600 [Candidatus Pacebacteria bacterium]|nr:hypothetical protein [Candidatus Paceibacterota bacterium]
MTNELWYNGNQLNLSTRFQSYPAHAIAVSKMQFVIIDGVRELEVTCTDPLGTHVFYFLKQNVAYLRIG